MRNTQKPFRLAIWNALNGHLSYDATNIPISDHRKAEVDSTRIYVTFGKQTETPARDLMNDSTWITQSSIDLLIHSKTFSQVSSDIVNDVSDQILQLLLPTPQINGFTEPMGFQVQNIELVFSELGSLQVRPGDFALTQLLTITAQIVQQS